MTYAFNRLYGVILLLNLYFDRRTATSNQYCWEQGMVTRDRSIENSTLYPNSKQGLMPPWLFRLRRPCRRVNSERWCQINVQWDTS